jgi:hypothetical protein
MFGALLDVKPRDLPRARKGRNEQFSDTPKQVAGSYASYLSIEGFRGAALNE